MQFRLSVYLVFLTVCLFVCLSCLSVYFHWFTRDALSKAWQAKHSHLLYLFLIFALTNFNRPKSYSKFDFSFKISNYKSHLFRILKSILHQSEQIQIANNKKIAKIDVTATRNLRLIIISFAVFNSKHMISISDKFYVFVSITSMNRLYFRYSTKQMYGSRVVSLLCNWFRRKYWSRKRLLRLHPADQLVRQSSYRKKRLQLLRQRDQLVIWCCNRDAQC